MPETDPFAPRFYPYQGGNGECLFCDGIALRAAGADSRGPGTLTGYAVKWNTLSAPLVEKRSGQGFREKFRSRAFADSLAGADVLAVTEHREGAATVFGRTTSGTLKLYEDDVGLRYENELPDTSAGRDLAVQVARGDIRGVSVGFRPDKDGIEWADIRSELPVRIVNKARIIHLSYEPRPAYRDTSIALRSLEAARASAAEPDAAPAADDRVMIALYPPADVAARLAIEGGEPADSLHLTLAYLGRAIEVGTANIEKAAAVCGRVASWGWPLSGLVSGSGRFSSPPGFGEEDVAVALVDVPMLAELRQQLACSLECEGIAPSKSHGFTPHISLAYIDPAEPSPLGRIEPASVAFGALSLVVEGARRDFPLAPGASLRSEIQDPPPATPEPEPSHALSLARARLRLAEAES